jgi:riboflavin synthase
MFTGIIEEVGVVQAVKFLGNRSIIRIEAYTVLEDLKIGDSIAVNGACLTATDVSKNAFSADVSQETLRVTNLGNLRPKSHVNLERALRVSDRLDGHLVQGHVDDTAKILSMQKAGYTFILSISVPESIRRYIVTKGSIAIDGISLTVNTCDDKRFTCTIIPHTVKQTNLRLRKVGDIVNLESDIIGRYVERLMSSRQDVQQNKRIIDYNMLKEYGW